MKLLVFEYSSICLNENLLSEGFNMLKCILNDLDKNSFFEVYYLINKTVDSFNYDNLNAIYLKDDLMEWLKNNSKDYDYALFIAPEDDLIQYHITKILEENRVGIIGSDSVSSYICSSKKLTYDNVSEDILKINTIKYKSEELDYKIISREINKKEFIVKPDNKTSSDLIFVVDNENTCNEVKKMYEKYNIDYLLVQEYIKGTPISVSLICNNNNIIFLSINSQEIIQNDNKIGYTGCKTPIDHPLKNELTEISNNIVKCIPGLKGFVGIDYIIQNEKIYFVEINSRITTPYIVLQKNCNQNLTNSIIEFVLKNQKINLNFEKQGKFIR
ncbi:MAG: ATP-grasp domain-containing protein [Methanosphaera stadtmanae]|nr:ATP-grasp domain-containing protein [Methanosphaera stadtmanae]